MVLKFDVPVAFDFAEVTMPIAADIVHVGSQTPGFVTFWAECYIDNKGVKHTRSMVRTFKVFGTGMTIPETRGWRYRGTTQEPETGLVWHLYETAS